MPTPNPAQRIASLFRRAPIRSLQDVERTVPGRSRRSLYRDLRSLGYLASYTHAGAYYTLRSLAAFGEHGVWFHQGVGFSVHGTLKATCQHLVQASAAGKTHEEVALVVHVRTHNTLLDLVQAGGIGRESVGPTFLYVSAEASRAAAQVQERLRLLQAEAPSTHRRDSDVVIEVLLELVRAAKDLPFTATGLTRRLLARGVGVTSEEVADVLREHGIVKKGRHSRSRSSKR